MILIKIPSATPLSKSKKTTAKVLQKGINWYFLIPKCIKVLGFANLYPTRISTAKLT
jgi:hypothetical protein